MLLLAAPDVKQDLRAGAFSGTGVSEVAPEPDPAALTATAAEHLDDFQPPRSEDGIQVDDLNGSPDDELEIQTGAESLFDSAGTDLSQYGDDSEQ